MPTFKVTLSDEVGARVQRIARLDKCRPADVIAGTMTLAVENDAMGIRERAMPQAKNDAFTAMRPWLRQRNMGHNTATTVLATLRRAVKETGRSDIVDMMAWATGSEPTRVRSWRTYSVRLYAAWKEEA